MLILRHEKFGDYEGRVGARYFELYSRDGRWMAHTYQVNMVGLTVNNERHDIGKSEGSTEAYGSAVEPNWGLLAEIMHKENRCQHDWKRTSDGVGRCCLKCGSYIWPAYLHNRVASFIAEEGARNEELAQEVRELFRPVGDDGSYGAVLGGWRYETRWGREITGLAPEEDGPGYDERWLIRRQADVLEPEEDDADVDDEYDGVCIGEIESVDDEPNWMAVVGGIRKLDEEALRG